MKGKVEKERYTHLNAEFQRIARRDKETLLSDQCKEIEENNRMGKSRDLFKKYQGNNSCKDGLNKGQKWYGPNRNDMKLTENQCKEIEENNRMGKSRDLFKRYQGNISCKDELNKGQKWHGPKRSRRY